MYVWYVCVCVCMYVWMYRVYVCMYVSGVYILLDCKYECSFMCVFSALVSLSLPVLGTRRRKILTCGTNRNALRAGSSERERVGRKRGNRRSKRCVGPCVIGEGEREKEKERKRERERERERSSTLSSLLLFE